MFYGFKSKNKSMTSTIVSFKRGCLLVHKRFDMLVTLLAFHFSNELFSGLWCVLHWLAHTWNVRYDYHEEMTRQWESRCIPFFWVQNEQSAYFFSLLMIRTVLIKMLLFFFFLVWAHMILFEPHCHCIIAHSFTPFFFKDDAYKKPGTKFILSILFNYVLLYPLIGIIIWL